VTGEQITTLGDIPIRETTEIEKKEDDGGIDLIWIIIIVVILVVIFAALIGWQVKRTRDYQNMPLIEDEWVNVPVPHSAPLESLGNPPQNGGPNQ